MCYFSPLGSVCVCLGPDASLCDEIRAVCQAVCLCTVLHPVSPLEGALKQLSMSHSNNHWELVHESHKLMDQIFQPFLKDMVGIESGKETAGKSTVTRVSFFRSNTESNTDGNAISNTDGNAISNRDGHLNSEPYSEDHHAMET
uniref:Root UVB sensitive protein C-terminal domain-containing protein n=1 Tax=Hucho hucho TaxID=62062 RepID=A0A4W5K0U3_9TELE